MRRAAWCEECRKPFQSKSRKQTLCPTCATEPQEDSSDGEEPPDATLQNTLAPDAGGATVPLEVVIDGPLDEIDCPWCAERIKARAKVCKHCGHDVEDEAPTRERRGRGGALASPARGTRATEVHVHYGAAQTGATNGGIAAVLSFFVPGLGQIYAGLFVRGLVIMFVLWPMLGFFLYMGGLALVIGTRIDSTAGAGALASYALFAGVLSLAGWVVQMVDAYNCAMHAGEPATSVRGRRGRR